MNDVLILSFSLLQRYARGCGFGVITFESGMTDSSFEMGREEPGGTMAGSFEMGREEPGATDVILKSNAKTFLLTV